MGDLEVRHSENIQFFRYVFRTSSKYILKQIHLIDHLLTTEFIILYIEQQSNHFRINTIELDCATLYQRLQYAITVPPVSQLRKRFQL